MRWIFWLGLIASLAINGLLVARVLWLDAELESARSAIAQRNAMEQREVDERVERRIQAEIAERRRLRGEIDANLAPRQHRLQRDEQAGIDSARQDLPEPTGSVSEAILSAGRQ